MVMLATAGGDRYDRKTGMSGTATGPFNVAIREPRSFIPSQAFEAALLLHRQGKLRDAEGLYRAVLKAAPDHSGAFHHLGVVKAQQGKFNEAIRLIRRAIEKQPRSAEAHNDLGVALESVKRYAEAIPCYERALALKPGYAEASFNFGNALQALERHDEAIGRFTEALSRRRDHAEAHNNLGKSLSALGRHEEAIGHFERAISLRPHYAEAHYNMGNALKALERDEAAIAQFETALAIKPDYFEARNNLAMTLSAKGRDAEALAQHEKAAAIKPNQPGTHYHIGKALWILDRKAEAIKSFERAVALKPDYVEAHYSLGSALWDGGLREAAIGRWEKALALQPDFVSARFGLCFANLPILYCDEVEIAQYRVAYERALRELCADFEGGRLPGNLEAALAAHLPFFLPYQGLNDRDLQSLWGRLACQALGARYLEAATLQRPSSNEKIRVGIVSGYFYGHTVGKLLIRGWLKRLDRRKFAIYGYHTKRDEDATTELAVELCDRFVQGPLTIERWREEILSDRPHILLYPEIGMDGPSVLLAAQRLAAVQCMAWGHPETTGMPTVDYFLSSDLMEPPDGQSHYNERLVRLPNLSIYYEPPELKPVTMERSQLGLRSDAIAFWCGQSVYKYLPQYDQIYPRIARELGNCQFVFIRYHVGAEVTKLFRKRLEDAFSNHGLKAADHCVFLDSLSINEFVTAIGQCDIYLDSIGWSGGNTTLESLEHALPIVTMRAPLMRGRHSAAIVQRIGVTETITESVDEYVSVAVRLGRDPAWRSKIKGRMESQKHRVYRDDSAIAALEEFLHRAAYSPPAAHDADDRVP
jgi:protein O-GlcNAc transferase